jgi:hypothetical protein
VGVSNIILNTIFGERNNTVIFVGDAAYGTLARHADQAELLAWH